MGYMKDITGRRLDTYEVMDANFITSPLVRSMVNAPPLTSPPVITASATATLPLSGMELGQTDWPNPPALRVSGGPLFVYGVDNRTYVRDTHRTDGTFGVWQGSYRVEFDLDGAAFEFKTRTPNASGSYFRIWVNEQPHALTPQPLRGLSGLADSTDCWVKVAFPTHEQRRIVIELEGTFPTPFQGVRIAATATALPPQIRSPRMMWLGDSYGYGLGATYRANAFPIHVGRLLGIADVWNQTAVSGSGFLHEPTAPARRYRFRLADDVYPYAPDILFIAGTLNDNDQTPSAVATELDWILTDVRANLPNVKIIGTSPLFVANPQSTMLVLRDAIAPVFAAHGVDFIDLLEDGTFAYFTGTGRVTAPSADGNADFYRAADGTHPADAGHAALARLVAGKAGKLLRIDVGETSPPVATRPPATAVLWQPAGSIAETCSRLQRIAAIPLTSGRLMVSGGIVVPAGKRVSSITFASASTAGASLTHQWFCLLDQSRNVLARTTNDTSTAWAASTAKTLSFRTTLSAPLSTGAPITALPVAAITNEVAPGTPITITEGANTQTFITSAVAVMGATSIPVQSVIPNFAYTTAAVVPTPWTPAVNTPVYLGIVVAATTPPTIQGPETAAAGTGAAGVTPIIAGLSTSSLTDPASLGATASALTPGNTLWAYLS